MCDLLWLGQESLVQVNTELGSVERALLDSRWAAAVYMHWLGGAEGRMLDAGR